MVHKLFCLWFSYFSHHRRIFTLAMNYLFAETTYFINQMEKKNVRDKIDRSWKKYSPFCCCVRLCSRTLWKVIRCLLNVYLYVWYNDTSNMYIWSMNIWWFQGALLLYFFLPLPPPSATTTQNPLNFGKI